MAYKRVVAAALFAALVATGSAQAQSPNGGCRKKCDASFSGCTKRGSPQNLCLRTWHACKQQCSAQAQARPGKLQTAAAAGATAKGRR